MQLPENQPTPTCWPMATPLALEPTAVTRPTTSWPSVAGNCEMPNSSLKIDRSE
jgi:hypothetical protein